MRICIIDATLHQHSNARFRSCSAGYEIIEREGEQEGAQSAKQWLA
jgi:hypothetical protein